MKRNNKKYYLSAEVVDEHGKSITQKVEVSEQIYREYTKSVWREESMWRNERYYQESSKEKRLPDEIKYAFDRKRLPRVVSLDSIIGAGGEENLPYEPDFTNEMSKEKEEKIRMSILVELIRKMTKEEKKLYQELFVNGLSERQYARKLGVDKRTVAWHKQKLLRRLKTEMIKKLREI